MSRPLLLAFVLVVAARPALAQSIAVLELRLSRVPGGLSEQIRQRLRDALSSAGYSVVEQAAAAERLARAGGPPACLLGPCLTRVGQSLKVERILIGGIAAQGTSYDVTLTMLETGGGSALAQINERCNVCTFKEIEDVVAEGASRLHKQALVFLAARAVLRVHSTPAGADVLLDGLPAGHAPLTQVLPPGQHTVEVTKRGFAESSVLVDLEAGKNQTIKVDLVRGTGGKEELITFDGSSRTTRPRWLRWTLLGSGVVLGAVGGGLLAMDGNETSDPRYLHDTGTAGTTLLTLGAVTAAASGVIFLLDLLSGSGARSHRVATGLTDGRNLEHRHAHAFSF